MSQLKPIITNGYNIHDITKLVRSFDGDRSHYVEIADNQLKQATLAKYQLLSEIESLMANYNQNVLADTKQS